MTSVSSDTRSWQARLIDLPRWLKRALLALSDLFLLGFALWLAYTIRLGFLYVPPGGDYLLLLIAAPLIGVLTFFQLGLYRLVTRFISPKGSAKLIVATGLSVLLWSLLVLLSGITGVPRSVVILYGVIGASLIWGSRQIAGFILKGVPFATPATFGPERRIPVAIYGAGNAGVQLMDALRRSGRYVPVGFIDETPTLWGQVVGGVKVYRPKKIAKLVERDGVKEILLALPEASRRRHAEIIRDLAHLRARVKTLPALEDIASGRVSVSDLRSLQVEDLLGRDPVPPDPELLARNVVGKSVLVTGAGGSIGGELARQILRLGPKKLVLFEIAEPALYTIEQQLRDALARRPADPPKPELVGVLGSVLDVGLVHATLARHGIETIYHAAAYKHVPIVETNPAAGISNNTFGTKVVAEAARRTNVERVVLISTDKAVRPTNIMGASKRLAELILQAHAAASGCETVFTMVRFGNVLDSSGSVVRLFRRQIEEGGPVTVTHPEVVRYFMSIPEAAALVIQAGAMAKGGDVFVLDMGEPIRIDTLARTMIRLMGLEVEDADTPDGDIAISYIGLRPGEKLYEELLIGERTTKTEHPRIARNHEPFRPLAEIERELESVRTAIQSGNLEAIHAVLERTVEGYSPDRRLLGAEPWTKKAEETLH